MQVTPLYGVWGSAQKILVLDPILGWVDLPLFSFIIIINNGCCCMFLSLPFPLRTLGGIVPKCMTFEAPNLKYPSSFFLELELILVGSSTYTLLIKISSSFLFPCKVLSLFILRSLQDILGQQYGLSLDTISPKVIKLEQLNPRPNTLYKWIP